MLGTAFVTERNMAQRIRRYVGTCNQLLGAHRSWFLFQRNQVATEQYWSCFWVDKQLVNQINAETFSIKRVHAADISIEHADVWLRAALVLSCWERANGSKHFAFRQLHNYCRLRVWCSTASCSRCTGMFVEQLWAHYVWIMFEHIILITAPIVPFSILAIVMSGCLHLWVTLENAYHTWAP